ncbi:MAG: hypothetical protein JRH12_03450 [Deltaproteobacteria bacterium]|jgi:hypothetical protein|nr:hypothetical protein [Deltaproteobacteria bacterium]MBW2479687.1 hypothetical protein [Deltaproteobacteria bacterium]
MDPNAAVKNIIAAHGGEDIWTGIEALEAEISTSGLLFKFKRRPVLDHVRVTASAHEPRFVFHDFPSAGLNGELVGDREVRIVSQSGKIVQKREAPRAAFHGLRRMFSWDDLDFIYFGGYATWNYLVAPFFFMRDGFYFEWLEPVRVSSPFWRRLKVTMPEDLPTHCREQIFYFDDNWHLQRLDYVAEVVGAWAHAAHLCEDYQDFNGIKAPTRRRVRPILVGDTPLPGPILVALDIHHIQPV